MTYGEKYLLARHGSTNRRARRAQKAEERKQAAKDRRRKILEQQRADAAARSDAFFGADYSSEGGIRYKGPP